MIHSLFSLVNLEGNVFAQCDRKCAIEPKSESKVKFLLAYRLINFVFVADCELSEDDINIELRKLVRELIGPIAACHLTASTKALPRTRSGKIARKSIAELARNKLNVAHPFVYRLII